MKALHTTYTLQGTHTVDVVGHRSSTGVSAVVCDAFDLKGVEAVLDGCDAAITTLGGSAGGDGTQLVDYAGNRNVIESAGILGITRVVMVTSVGCGSSREAISDQVYQVSCVIRLHMVGPCLNCAILGPVLCCYSVCSSVNSNGLGLFHGHIQRNGLYPFNALLLKPYLQVLEKALKAKTLAENMLLKYYTNSEWTIIRPGGLKSDAATGTAVLTENTKAAGVINRADVADLAVQALNSPSTVRKILSAVDPGVQSEYDSVEKFTAFAL